MLPLASEKIAATPLTGFASKPYALARDAHAVTSVDVYDNSDDVLPAWQELLRTASASPYQTPGFVLPWLETRGVEAEIEPVFIVERDRHGKALALFCLGLQKLGPFRAAVFLGGKDSNFNLGLFQPGHAPDTLALTRLFKTAAQSLRSRRPDLFLLLNQPLRWGDWSNPLAACARQASPSFAYQTLHLAGAEAFFKEKLSKDSRKKLHKKEARLAEIGPVRYVTANAEGAMRAQIIDAFFAQKIARFEAQKIEAGFANKAMRDFVEMASQPSRNGAEGHLELHALFCGERIVATYGGATHRNHFSAFFNSFDADPEIAKSSPGDLLLLKLAAAKSAEGVTSFDLGIGEARYKKMLCDETIELFDCFIPITLKGRVLATALALRQTLKRSVKQNTKLFEIAKRLRAKILG